MDADPAVADRATKRSTSWSAARYAALVRPIVASAPASTIAAGRTVPPIGETGADSLRASWFVERSGGTHGLDERHMSTARSGRRDS